MPTSIIYRGDTGAGKAYRSACNMDLRDGTIRPADRQMRAAISGLGPPAPTIVPWTQSSRAAPWFAVADVIYYFRSGAKGGSYAGGATITDLCPFETGGGVASVIVCYGTGDFIDRCANDGSLTASTDVKLVFATMVDDSLYGVGNYTAGTGTVAYSTYHVSKCPAGSDPKTASNYSTGIPVGDPGQPITSIRCLNGAPVIAKTDGLYIWRDSLGKYVNVLEFKFAVHEDNGKGMFVGKGSIFYPTADGSLWRYDGSRVEDVSPKTTCALHRDAPHLRAPITAGCVASDYVYVATAPWEVGWTQEHGIKVFKCVTGAPDTYTDLTTNCTDGDLATVGAVGGLLAADFLYIGADVPFEAVKIVPGTANTSTTGRFTTAQIGTSYDTDDGWQGATGVDSTAYGGIGLAVTGYRRLLHTQDYGCHKLMTLKTVNSTSKYWMRFYPADTLSAGTTIAEIYILPSRPPIAEGTWATGADAASVTNGPFEYTGPDAAGILPHILAGRVIGGDWRWDDVYTLQATAPIRAMTLCQADTKQAEENAGMRLLALSRHHLHLILMGQSAMQGSPVNENYADGVAMGSPIVYFLRNDLSDGQDRFSKRKEAREHHVYGEYVDGSDTLTVFQRWDHNAWDKAGTSSNAPTRIGAPAGNRGLVLETAIGYEDVNVEIAGPRIPGYDIAFEDTNLPFDAETQPDAVTPERE